MIEGKRIMVIFGTRPEAIKMCPVIRSLKEKGINISVCLTGQHADLIKSTLDFFGVEPDHNLKIMEENQSLESITVKILEGMQKFLKEKEVNLVLVHGDTTTALAASLAAFYHRIPIGHVEAGLRTYDQEPYPEEFNRQAIDSMSDIFFAPTDIARENLIRECKNKSRIFVTGNTVVDTMKLTISENFTHPELEWAEGSKLILFTAHRRENMGKPMVNMFKAVLKMLHNFKNVKVLFPMHPNKEIRQLAMKFFSNENRIHLIDSLNVVEFHNFINSCYFVLTDSGGIQEEAPILGKPVLIMRALTERLEGIQTGNAKLVGTSEQSIYEQCKELLENSKTYKKMSKKRYLYGNGNASDKIGDIIISMIKRGNI